MSGLWTDEVAHLRVAVRSAAARVPGGARSVAGVTVGGFALLLAVCAALATSSAPLVAIPVLLAGCGLVPAHRAQQTAVLLAGPALLLLLALVALTVRGAGSWPTAVALVLTGVAASGLAFVLAARDRALQTALTSARDAVDAVSVLDPLTGVANRQGLDLVGRQVVETARRQGDAAHCTFVEIGGLAEARGKHGPDAVADVLVALAEALRGVTRTTDVVARWKDSVFVVVGQGAGMDPNELERRVRRRLGADAGLDRTVWSGRIVVGGAMLPPWDSGTLETLIVRAAEELRARTVRKPAIEPMPRHDPAT